MKGSVFCTAKSCLSSSIKFLQVFEIAQFQVSDAFPANLLFFPLKIRFIMNAGIYNQIVKRSVSCPTVRHRTCIY